MPPSLDLEPIVISRRRYVSRAKAVLVIAPAVEPLLPAGSPVEPKPANTVMATPLRGVVVAASFGDDIIEIGDHTGCNTTPQQYCRAA
ncbi:MAG: hypothetical protein R3D30_07660 [Hyphomicrobiales bacterium]